MKKRKFVYFLFPFLLILVSIYWLNQFNQRQIKGKFLQITAAEGLTIGNLLELSGQHLIEGNPDKLYAFLNHLFKNESIVYIGMFRGEELVYLLSRYEGFFPVVQGRQDYRIIDTAVGKIFETSAQFRDSQKQMYMLYIGFDFDFLTLFEHAAENHFLIVAGLFSLIMIVLITLVFYFDKKFYSHTLELQKEKQEKERFKELSLLTSEIAHEIKNPLNALYLSFHTLEKYCSNDTEALFYREAIKNEVRRITTILESYADLSKEIKPNYTLVDLTLFMGNIQLLLAPELESQGVTIDVSMNGSPHVYTDDNLLKQILFNFIKNAMEAGASGIYIEFSHEKNILFIRIGDNGKGITPEVVVSIFKPYFSTKTKGMGLGLHIVLRLLLALHGEVQLLSHEPGNTCFQISLPVVYPE